MEGHLIHNVDLDDMVLDDDDDDDNDNDDNDDDDNDDVFEFMKRERCLKDASKESFQKMTFIPRIIQILLFLSKIFLLKK